MKGVRCKSCMPLLSSSEGRRVQAYIFPKNIPVYTGLNSKFPCRFLFYFPFHSPFFGVCIFPYVQVQLLYIVVSTLSSVFLFMCFSIIGSEGLLLNVCERASSIRRPPRQRSTSLRMCLTLTRRLAKILNLNMS